MPILPHDTTTIRRAADLAVHRVLRRGRALLSPEPGWRQPELEELLTALHTAASAPEGTWADRWEGAVRGRRDAVVQLAAEALYLHALFPTDLRPATKRSLVGTTLGWMSDPRTLPADLDDALETGLARTGIAYTRRRLSQVSFLLRAAAAWQGEPPRRRREALDDPWAFKDLLWEVPVEGGHAQREVLLHLVHPESFEPIVSRSVKRAIVAGFEAPAPDGDLDRALCALRTGLAGEHGPGFSFVDEAVAAHWRS